MIRFQYKHRRVKLTVEHCDDDGFCKPCKSTRCIATANNFDISTSTGGQIMYIGGVKDSVNSAIITKQSSLLLTSLTIAGVNEPHFTLKLQNGQVHLSGNSSKKKNELLVEEKVNDGKWKMIRFQYKHRRVKLTVEHCDDDGFCKPCKSTRCIATANNFESVLLA
ncbi:hypothetical protein WUBG_17400 [Wuchereria bancrofti]|uniref:Laminin G domain-containing protein n=1 Tax=Wuchereria bancrofti TaxID=6293 RepID=J9E8L3_WUCBA|nr:hypothetical protein WUBG_17400 [Wuchereria bancrofti]